MIKKSKSKNKSCGKFFKFGKERFWTVDDTFDEQKIRGLVSTGYFEKVVNEMI